MAYGTGGNASDIYHSRLGIILYIRSCFYGPGTQDRIWRVRCQKNRPPDTTDAREDIFSCIFFIAANQTLQQKHRPCKTRKERKPPFF